MPVLEALELRGARRAKPGQERAGHLDRPAVARLLRPVGGRFDEVERVVDVLAVLTEADVLMIGEADVRVAVVDDVQRLDRGQEIS